MKNPHAVLILACTILLLSCNKQHDNDGIMCTTEYRMLTVSIKDPESKPVILSNYFVKKTSTGEIIDFATEDHFIDSVNRVQGIYFLCTDGMMGMTAKNGTDFEFHGILDSTEIVFQKYIIGNNRCHVELLAGKTAIVVGK